ncbi:MAG: response regulator [Sphingobacteriales bacterium]|nr:MAG: response regulator [Sphingobacteriales bacterium]
MANQGTGIGLSIAREFVKLHGGSIQVNSKPGEGTSFSVRLPFDNPRITYTEEQSAGLFPTPVSISLPAPVPDHEKLTLLLVEDNDEFRDYVKKQLSQSYRIVEAADGQEGWQKALSAHPKIIISDIDMPGMDGISLCRKLRADKRTKHIPVILLTALSGDANALSGLETGASDYLTKPFNFGILHLKIQNLLALNQNFEETYSRQLKVSLPEPEAQSHDEQLLLKITLYIEANIDNPDLSVEEISKHVFMSRRSLYSKIVSLTGETPVEFVRSIKLARAASLLEKSDLKMGEVAYNAGFTTANYFTRAFRAKYNMSPTEYAQLKRKEREAVPGAQK